MDLTYVKFLRRMTASKSWLIPGMLFFILVCANRQVLADNAGTTVAEAQQQARTVTGTVAAENGEPLIGVNIIVKGQPGIGAITDADGKFSFPVPAGNITLVFSYIGFATQEMAASSGAMRVVMHEDELRLDEVVAIGYGVVKKSDVTGSVVSVDSEEMMRRNPTTVAQGLQGAAAGVQVIRSGGPAGATSVRIRGIATINNSTEPLYVIDGIRVGDNIDFLNPGDVLNIEVLKDASATAIYGSEGANGVILITTRKGEMGRARLNFAANYGVQTNSKKIDNLNAYEYVHAARQAAANDNTAINAVYAGYDRELTDIDWQDEMSRTAFQQNYNMNISGGSEASKGMLSLGYMNNEGIVINSNFRRLNIRTNIEHTVRQILHVGINTTYMYNEMYSGGGSPGLGGALFSNNGMIYFASLPPTMDDLDENGNLRHVPIRYPNGEWGHFPLNTTDIQKDFDNPVAATTESVNAKNRNYGNVFIGNAFAELNILKNLTLRSTGGLRYIGSSSHNYSPVNQRTRTRMLNTEDQLTIRLSENKQFSLETYLTYNLNIKDEHRITLMGGHSISRTTSTVGNMSSSVFAVPTIRRIELTQRPSSISVTEGGLGLEMRLQSFFGRLNYSLQDKYLLTASVRYDGSSNFGAGNRWGTFPSVALAWRASEESFIRNLNLFSNLKLRLTYGMTGNSGFPTNKSVNQLTSGSIHYYFYNGNDFTLAPGMAQTSLIDTNLKWETNESMNYGIDFGFDNNRYSFTLDYFVRDAKDLLLNRSIRSSTGYTQIYTNAGHIRNSGFEFTAAYQRAVGDLFFNIRLNGSTLVNEVIDVGEPIRADFGYGDNWDNASVTQNGYPIGSFYGYRVDHVFQNQAEIDALNAKSPIKVYQSEALPGDYMFKDLNGNGYLDDDDREILGHGFPDLNYGMSVGVNYKNWDFNLYVYGVAGQQVMSLGYMYLNNMRHGEEGLRNIAKEAVGRAWTPEKPTNYPRLSTRDSNHNGRVSDAWLKNADFLRIQNLQVGYTFAKTFFKRVPIDNLRLYASVENLYTFTNYVGNLEPEFGTASTAFAGNVLLNGFDNGHYPLQRTFAFGLSMNF
jgi:TonB-linked SusC/RagA family outer membrane protein